ncbi:MAG: nucleotidyltransferase family protein [Actinomycetota bacterium]
MTTSRQRLVAAALVEAVRRPAEDPRDESRAALAALTPDLDPLLVQAARFHRISPAVHIALQRECGRVVPELQEDHAEQRRKHLLSLIELERLTPVLEDTGVAWVAFKGPVLASTVYERPDLRSYNDLDILVDPCRLGAVLKALDGHGAQLLDRNWKRIARDRRGELTLLLPHGTPLDLHWSLINDARIRRQIRLDPQQMLGRRLYRKVGRPEVPVLEPHDRVIHLAVHAVLSGGHRLLWLADMDRALTFCDPGVLAERTRETGTGLLVAAALERCNRVLGTRVPPIDEGRLWRALLRRVDAARSPVLAFTGPSGQSIVRATRGSTAASYAELGVQCGRYFRARFNRVPVVNPLFEDVDGGERDRFLHTLDGGDETSEKARMSAETNPEPLGDNRHRP